MGYESNSSNSLKNDIGPLLSAVFVAKCKVSTPNFYEVQSNLYYY